MHPWYLLILYPPTKFVRNDNLYLPGRSKHRTEEAEGGDGEGAEEGRDRDRRQVAM